jgi:hypothetical protein
MTSPAAERYKAELAELEALPVPEDESERRSLANAIKLLRTLLLKLESSK